MKNPQKQQTLSLWQHSARLAHYDTNLNGSSHGAAITKVASLLPAHYQPSVEGLSALASEGDSANRKEKRYNAALLLQLKRLAGNHSGNMYGVLVAYFHQLSQTQTLVQSFWSGLRSIFSYCAAIVCVATVVIGLVLTRVLPELQVAFTSAGADLPEFTRFALQVAEHAPLILLAVILCTVLIFALVRCVKQQIITLSPLWQWLGKLPAFRGLHETYRYFLFLQYSQILAHADARLTPALQKELWHLAYGGAAEAQPGSQIHLLQSTLAAAEKLGAQPQELEYQRGLIADCLLEQLLVTRAAVWAAMMVLVGVLTGGVVIAVYLPIFALGSIA